MSFDARPLFDISLHAWDKVEAASIRRKESINHLLGLNEQNEYRQILEITPQHSDIVRKYPVTANFVGWCLKKSGLDGEPNYGTNIVMEGKQERKITRVLSKAFADEGIMRVLTHYKDKIFPELGITDTKQFLQAWGERKVTGHLVLSTNFHDLLTPSDNSAFRSCHRIGGEYYNSALSHVMSNCSFMAYVTDNLDTMKKIGRVWCMLLPSGACFVHFGSYGTFHSGEYDMLQGYVKSCCPQLNVKDVRWNEDNYCGYMDSSHYTIGAKDTRYTFEFDDPRCLTCGCEFHHDSNDGNCDSCCGKSYCSHCDCRVEWVCDTCNCCEDCCSCAVCERCGSRHRDGDYFCFDCDRCEDCCTCVVADCGCRNNGVCGVCYHCDACCTCEAEQEEAI